MRGLKTIQQNTDGVWELDGFKMFVTLKKRRKQKSYYFAYKNRVNFNKSPQDGAKCTLVASALVNAGTGRQIISRFQRYRNNSILYHSSNTMVK